MKHYNITIYGRVQGVGFRWEAKKMAHVYGIKGIVKNEYDGSVYIEAEGEISQLSEYVKWCKKGPDLARVGEVTVKEGEMKSFTDFDITH